MHVSFHFSTAHQQPSTSSVMPKGRPARSFFSSLPYELKTTLRSQSFGPVTTLSAQDSIQVKAELIADTVQFGALLPTQPQSPIASQDALSLVESTEGPIESSTSSKRLLVDTSDRRPAARGRKRKFKPPGNDFLGHRWDCTGLVPRYTDYSELPSGLAKCSSE